jgi:uncharacterized protein YerC
MVNVSKNKLKLKVRKDIISQFIETIAELDKNSANVFFQEFFTDSERLLFAKRLAIIYLLHEGISFYRISLLLKVSRDTVYRINREYTPVEKDKIIKTCEQFNAQEGLLFELKELLVNGFSRDPKKRMKWLNEFEEKYAK